MTKYTIRGRFRGSTQIKIDDLANLTAGSKVCPNILTKVLIFINYPKIQRFNAESLYESDYKNP